MKQFETKHGISTGAFALAFALCAATAAFGSSGHGAVRAACQADVEALCPDATSHADVRGCLQEHAAELSAPCTAKLEEMRAHHDAVRTACGGDLSTLCPDAQGWQSRKCLHEHRDQLSAACSAALECKH